MNRQRSGGSSETVFLVLLTGLSAALLLTGLDRPYLWQDEAQTALIAKTILSHGVPLGTDGLNLFSQELGVEYGDDHIWKWHTWLSFYLVAGSFLAFGTHALAARLPFALLGVASVVLAYLTGTRLGGTRRAAAIGAGLLALSVPYLLLCRSARWYAAAAFFSLLGLYAYLRLDRGRRGPALLLFAAATLLFHTHYLYCATLLASLWIHAACCERARLAPVAWVSAAVVLLSLPWLAFLSTIRLGDDYAARLYDPARSVRFAGRYLEDLGRYFFTPLLLLVPLARAALRRAGRPPPAAPAALRRNAALLAIFAAVTVAALALTSPWSYFRYLAPVAPPLLLLSGLLFDALLALSRPLGAVALGLWIAGGSLPGFAFGAGSLRGFAYERTHDFDGPIEGLVRFLREHAEPGDVVAIQNGDMPLKFYTGLRVIGGLTGEDRSGVRDARWIVPRRHSVAAEDRRVRRDLVDAIRAGDYQRHRLDYPDTTFENREDPRLHRFRTAPLSYPRVTVFERRK